MPNLKGPRSIFGANTTHRSTTAADAVGATGRDVDGNEWTYIKAEGVIPVYCPVDVRNGLSEAIASTDAKGFLGIAQTAFTDEQYGYILTKGRGLALVPSGTSIGDPLTAGSGALSATLTNAIKHVTAHEAAPLLSGTTQAKYVYLF
jgi:hypothetical protein